MGPNPRVEVGQQQPVVERFHLPINRLIQSLRQMDGQRFEQDPLLPPIIPRPQHPHRHDPYTQWNDRRHQQYPDELGSDAQLHACTRRYARATPLHIPYSSPMKQPHPPPLTPPTPSPPPPPSHTSRYAPSAQNENTTSPETRYPSSHPARSAPPSSPPARYTNPSPETRYPSSHPAR